MFIHKRYLLSFRKISLFSPRRRRDVYDQSFKAKSKSDLYEFNEVAVSRLHLVVLIQRADNLLARDKRGTSDPVCQLSLSGEQIQHTSVIKKTCYPEWNEVFTFGVRDVGAQHLVIKLHDYDTGKENDFLGYVRLPLRQILSEEKLKNIRMKKRREKRQRDLLQNQSGEKKKKGGRRPSQAFMNFSKTSSQAYEVAGTFGNEVGLVHNVDVLMGARGDRAFESAMFDLPLGYGPSIGHATKKRDRLGVKGTSENFFYVKSFSYLFERDHFQHIFQNI